MKYALVIGVVMGIFYIAAANLVLTELNELKYVYQNTDAIAQNAVR